MADNVTIDTITGSPVAKTLDIAAGGFHYQQVIVGDIARVSDSFTRVADTNQYAIGDHIASTVTAASITAANSSFVLASAIRDADLGGYIDQIVLVSDAVNTVASSWRVHFFDTDPYATVPASGDNIAISLSTNAADDYLGYIDVECNLSVFESETTGVGVPLMPIPIKAASGTTIWGVLEARDVYTPVSGEGFTLYAHISQG